MLKLIINIGLVLAIIYIVPFVVYGIGSVVAGLKPPEGASPARFLISVFVSKFGTAVTFALIFYFAQEELSGRWLLYAGLWWFMFIINESCKALYMVSAYSIRLSACSAEIIGPQPNIDHCVSDS